MEFKKMSVEELRAIVDRGLYYLSDMEYGRMAAFDEIARRLTLKDADLLLERDRAKAVDIELSKAFVELDNARMQVKMLVEALVEIRNTYGMSAPFYINIAEEAIDKIKS